MINFTDEQILKFKNAGFSAEEISLFSHKPEYAPTEEELNAIQTVSDVAETLKYVPKNLKKFFKKIEKTYGVVISESSTEQEFEEGVKTLALKDPEFAKQVAAYASLIMFAEEEGIE